jgi:hypothetical protein
MHAEELPGVLDTFAGLGDHEAALAALYAACGRIWHGDAALWDALADSERGHVTCLAAMARIVAERPAAFALGRPFSGAAGRLQASYAKDRAREVERGGMARRAGLLLAYEIERSIIETHLNELLRTEERGYLAIVERIVAETVAHCRLLERELRRRFDTVAARADTSTSS